MERELMHQLQETQRILNKVSPALKVEEETLTVLECISYAAENLRDAKKKEAPLIGWCFVQLIEDLLSDAAKVCLMLAIDPDARMLQESFKRSVQLFLKYIKHNDPILVVSWGIDMDVVN